MCPREGKSKSSDVGRHDGTRAVEMKRFTEDKQIETRQVLVCPGLDSQLQRFGLSHQRLSTGQCKTKTSQNNMVN